MLTRARSAGNVRAVHVDAAQAAELGEQPVEHADRLLHVGETQEEVVLAPGAGVMIATLVPAAKGRAAEAFVGKHATVEREFPVSLPASDHEARTICRRESPRAVLSEEGRLGTIHPQRAQGVASPERRRMRGAATRVGAAAIAVAAQGVICNG